MAEKLNKDTLYRAAKPKDTDYTINDGGGSVLLVKSSGVKTWRFIYRIAGKQNRLGFGSYPDTSLDSARRKAEEARAQTANGIDPSEVKKQAKQVNRADEENTKRKAAGLYAPPLQYYWVKFWSAWITASCLQYACPACHQANALANQ